MVSGKGPLNVISLPSDKGVLVLPARSPVSAAAICVYCSNCVTVSYRVWHHDRRLHHLYQRLNLYSQLSADQPTNHIWPSKPTGLLKRSASHWNVRDGLQTAIFLIIHSHSLTCLFPKPVSSFCKSSEPEGKKKMLALCRLFLLSEWGLKSKEHCEFVKWLLFAQRPRHCKLLVFAKGQPSFL